MPPQLGSLGIHCPLLVVLREFLGGLARHDKHGSLARLGSLQEKRGPGHGNGANQQLGVVGKGLRHPGPPKRPAHSLGDKGVAVRDKVRQHRALVLGKLRNVYGEFIGSLDKVLASLVELVLEQVRLGRIRRSLLVHHGHYFLGHCPKVLFEVVANALRGSLDERVDAFLVQMQLYSAKARALDVYNLFFLCVRIHQRKFAPVVLGLRLGKRSVHVVRGAHARQHGLQRYGHDLGNFDRVVCLQPLAHDKRRKFRGMGRVRCEVGKLANHVVPRLHQVVSQKPVERRGAPGVARVVAAFALLGSHDNTRRGTLD